MSESGMRAPGRPVAERFLLLGGSFISCRPHSLRTCIYQEDVQAVNVYKYYHNTTNIIIRSIECYYYYESSQPGP